MRANTDMNNVLNSMIQIPYVVSSTFTLMGADLSASFADAAPPPPHPTACSSTSAERETQDRHCDGTETSCNLTSQGEVEYKLLKQLSVCYFLRCYLLL